MKVLVLFESNTGNTRKVAELIGGAVALTGAEVAVRSVREVDLHELAVADLVFLGTWVDGLIIAGHRPGGAWRFRSLPTLERKPVALFATYAVHGADSMLKKFAKLVGPAGKGADIVARKAFNRRNLDEGIMQFVSEAFAEVPAAR